MADHQIGNPHGVTIAGIGGVNNKTNITGNTGTNPQVPPDYDDLDGIGAMRARLTAINAVTYSAAQLNKMTYNDLVYAIRLNDFRSGIKQ